MLMPVVRLGICVGLRSPRCPTMAPTFKFTSKFPIPSDIGAVPPRRVARFLSGENVISVLYRAEPLVSYALWKVRDSTVGRIRVVHPNEFVIFPKYA